MGSCSALMRAQEQDAAAPAETQSSIVHIVFSSGRSRFGETALHSPGRGPMAQSRAALRVIRGERKASREGWWGMRMPCPHSLLKEESR